jgi:hypothetical protein
LVAIRPLGETNDAEQPGMRRAASRARANHAESAAKPYVSLKYCAGGFSNVHILPRSKRPARMVSGLTVWADAEAESAASSARAPATEVRRERRKQGIGRGQGSGFRGQLYASKFQQRVRRRNAHGPAPYTRNR